MQPAETKTKPKYLLIIGIVIALAAIVGGAAYAVMRVSSQPDTKTSDTAKQATTEIKSDKKVTQQTLTRGLGDISESVDQSKEAHKAASAAVNDPSKRVKVSE